MAEEKAVAEVKAEVKAEEVKVEKAVAKKAVAKKAVAKKAEKPAAEKKVAAKKAEKPAVAKKAEKKVAAKKAEKANVTIQFAGKSFSQDELVKIAKDVWQYDLKKDVADLKDIELYVKPEECKVYYVMNGESGSFDI